MIIEPLNLGEISEEELKLAEAIMTNDENILIRYLRIGPTVGFKIVPATDDAAEVKQRVICTGIPYGAMVAFLHTNRLYVGWSRRHSGMTLENKLLTSLFEDTIRMMKDPAMVERVSRGEAKENYELLLNQFAGSVRGFLAGEHFSAIEPSPFAKKTGKLTAIIRGLRDTIHINGKNVVSAASGIIPKELSRNLPWFVKLAEELFKAQAVNVGTPELPTVNVKDLVVVEENLPAAAEG